MKNIPFDVPMADPQEDEFAFLKNIERRALIELGEYDVIRGILEEERKEKEEAEKELAEDIDEIFPTHFSRNRRQLPWRKQRRNNRYYGKKH